MTRPRPASPAAAETRVKPPSRKEFFRLARDYTPYVIADAEGLLFVVSTADRHRDKLFRKKRIKEWEVLTRAIAVIERTCGKLSGTTFVDVGASIGTTTLSALRAGFGLVLALEPEPGNFRLLRANLVLNEAEERVHALRVALSDRAGSGKIAAVPAKSGAAHLVGPEETSEWPTHDVSIKTLDDLVAEGTIEPQRVGLLWMDCEGQEAHVLAGARKTLEHGFPVVLEVNPDALRRTAGLDDVAPLLSKHFTHVLDLRDERAQVSPVQHIDGIIQTCVRRRKATDVLAFRPAFAERGI